MQWITPERADIHTRNLWCIEHFAEGPEQQTVEFSYY